MVKARSTISPQLGLDRTPLPHSPMSPAHKKAGYLDQKPAGGPCLVNAAQQQQHWSHKEQARPTQAGNTATDKAAQRAGEKDVGPNLYDKDKLVPISEASGGRAAQQVQEPVTAISPATLQQAFATEPGNVSQGSQHAKAASPDPSRQAAGQVAKRAEERLRELLMDSDYNEKNWCYVDPQVSSNQCSLGFEAIHEMRMAADPMPYCTSGCRSGLASRTLPPPTLLMRERSGLRVLCFDVQGVTQGPCSITEFRGWMQDLRSNPQLSLQYKQFSEVVAWRVCTTSPC